MPRTHTTAMKFTRFFGALGYLSCLMQWLWCLILIVPSLMQNDWFKDLMTPEHTAPAQTMTFSAPPLLALIIGVGVTALMLGVTIVVVVKLPAAAARRTEKLVQGSADQLVDATAHHRALPVKRRRALRLRYILLIKLVVTVLPFCLLITTMFVSVELSDAIIWTAGVFTLSWTVAWFGLQYLAAKIGKIPLDKVY